MSQIVASNRRMHLKVLSMGARDSPVCRALVLYTVKPGSTHCIPYGPQSTAGEIPECKVRNNC